MRDIILFGVVLASIPFMVKRPFVGVLFWVWIGLMNPQQLSWGAARSFPFAMIVALATFAGVLFNRDQVRFKGGGAIAILIMLYLWMSLTTVTAFNPALAYVTWVFVTKVLLMALIALLVINSKWQVDALLWVVVLSIGYFGIKGGAFTLLTGGAARVWGPPDSMVADNNALALALAIIVPLAEYLRTQATNVWVRRGLLGLMVLSGVATLGSQSRGALVAVSAMLLFLWLKSRRKALLGLALALMVPPAIMFMPDSWTNRMQTIQTYEKDSSAMQRINAWTTSINIANDRPLVGGGFNLNTRETFLKYSPNPAWVLVAHSIYFQVLGEHGWVGLALYLMLWLAIWRTCRRLIRRSRERPDLAWAGTLGAMVQVSAIAYLVGGAFLSLAYWDAPYYLMVTAMAARWVAERPLDAARSRDSRNRPAMTGLRSPAIAGGGQS